MWYPKLWYNLARYVCVGFIIWYCKQAWIYFEYILCMIQNQINFVYIKLLQFKYINSFLRINKDASLINKIKCIFNRVLMFAFFYCNFILFFYCGNFFCFIDVAFVKILGWCFSFWLFLLFTLYVQQLCSVWLIVQRKSSAILLVVCYQLLSAVKSSNEFRTG